MFIQTEQTPNPLTIKFIPGQAVLPDGGARQFSQGEQEGVSPLADILLSIDGVDVVFFGSDFVSVTKSDAGNWDVLKPEILTTIMDHMVAGKPIIIENDNQQAVVSDDSDDEITAQIRELIETRVRPAVAQDGGDIVFRGFEDGVVKLELYGACSGCPSSSLTLKDGIENMLKHYVPEVESVEAVGNEMAGY